jgi:hypothetical protein
MNIEERIQTRLSELQGALLPYITEVLQNTLPEEDMPTTSYPRPRRQRQLFWWNHYGRVRVGDWQYSINPVSEDERHLSHMRPGAELLSHFAPDFDVQHAFEITSRAANAADRYIRHVEDLTEHISDYYAGLWDAPPELMNDLSLLLGMATEPLTPESLNNFLASCWQALQPEEGAFYRAWDIRTSGNNRERPWNQYDCHLSCYRNPEDCRL